MYCTYDSYLQAFLSSSIGGDLDNKYLALALLHYEGGGGGRHDSTHFNKKIKKLKKKSVSKLDVD